MTIDDVYIKKVVHGFYYTNLYEIMLWYYYYKSKYRHIPRITGACYRNRRYFSRIPLYHRNIDRNVGLSIIKEAIQQVLTRHSGIPKYYNELILHNIITMKFETR